jgi:hypothetical protein
MKNTDTNFSVKKVISDMKRALLLLLYSVRKFLFISFLIEKCQLKDKN